MYSTNNHYSNKKGIYDMYPLLTSLRAMVHKWVAHELMARERVPLVEVHDNKWVDLVHELVVHELVHEMVVHELVHEMVVHELVPLLEEHNEMVHEMVVHELVPLLEEHNEMVHEMVGARGRVPLAEARDNK